MLAIVVVAVILNFQIKHVNANGIGYGFLLEKNTCMHHSYRVNHLSIYMYDVLLADYLVGSQAISQRNTVIDDTAFDDRIYETMMV